MVKDITKEDHYINIVVGFKIIYNQNQYLAYTEIPKKKREIRLEIYIGRLSNLKGQYLLFRSETESERRKVFDLFKQVFSGEPNEEIEMIDFSDIERISIVSSDEFVDKMDQYPNFFTLPKKEEEISANITLPSFLMKKKSKKDEPAEEIQFVEDEDVVLESPITVSEEEEHVEPIQDPVPIVMSVESKKDDVNELENSSLEEDIIEEQNQFEIVENKAEPFSSVEPLMESEEMNEPQEMEEMNGPQEIEEMNEPQEVEEIAQKEEPPVLQIQSEFDDHALNQKKSKRRGKMGVIVLMIVTLLLMASSIIVYLFILGPKNDKKKNDLDDNVFVPKTENLVCTLERKNNENQSTEQTNITFVYDLQSKKVLKEEKKQTVRMEDENNYLETKSWIIIFSRETQSTENVKYTYTYDDKNFTYHVLTERNYEKATAEEMDDTWKTTYDEAKSYYLNQGYTCDGIPPSSQKNMNLKSITGNDQVDYNQWLIKWKSASLDLEKSIMTVVLEVKNSDTKSRSLNGLLKLYDEKNQNLRNVVLNQKVEPGNSTNITVTVPSKNDTKNNQLGSLETVDLNLVTTYLIELYR